MAVMRRWWPLFGVAALLAAAGIAASTTSFGLSKIELPGSNEGRAATFSPVPPPPTVEPEPSQATSLELPPWVLWTFLALVTVVVAVVVVYFLRQLAGSGSRFRRRRLPRRDNVPPRNIAAEVVAAVEAGLLELDESDVDPRRAVIACWVRLERAAAAAGTPRELGDTSTDLVLRLLGTHRLSEHVLTAFADLYRRARYAARHDVDETMRDQARSALTRLRGELTAQAAAEGASRES
jgi:hypothetical protein